jgi:proteasome lid subunit RPN8/RPN11
MLELIKSHGLLPLIKNEFCEDLNKESCGIIYKDNKTLRFLKVENISRSPENHFLIDSSIIIDYDPIVIVHSHTRSCSTPSEIDIAASDELCIPYLIYSIRFDEFYLYENISV